MTSQIRKFLSTALCCLLLFSSVGICSAQDLRITTDQLTTLKQNSVILREKIAKLEDILTQPQKELFEVEMKLDQYQMELEQYRKDLEKIQIQLGTSEVELAAAKENLKRSEESLMKMREYTTQLIKEVRRAKRERNILIGITVLALLFAASK